MCIGDDKRKVACCKGVTRRTQPIAKGSNRYIVHPKKSQSHAKPRGGAVAVGNPYRFIVDTLHPCVVHHSDMGSAKPGKPCRVPVQTGGVVGHGGIGFAHADRAIAEYDLAPFVRQLGYQPHQVFRDQLAEAHLLVQPSVTASNGDTEGGAPTVVLEAQACGVPVLSTYHADIPEVTIDGETSRLVPERDVDALADAWLELLRHPESWPQMGRAGRALMEGQHGIDRLAGQLEERYDRLIV
ncbi:MAG: glycosyltransferase [candidate division Zixibacteria bacterium]|nr:glycosyltransferase [candidate division Zixibacteria bacterium]